MNLRNGPRAMPEPALGPGTRVRVTTMAVFIYLFIFLYIDICHTKEIS